jgi:hypothetical protein
MHAEVEQVVIDRARMCHPFLSPVLANFANVYVEIGSDQSQSAPNAPLHSSTTDTNYGDSSWPLYAMYSKIVQEEDNKTAKLHQKSADGILIFVSPCVTPLFLRTSIGKHRAVYTRSLSPYFLRSHSQT